MSNVVVRIDELVLHDPATRDPEALARELAAALGDLLAARGAIAALEDSSLERLEVLMPRAGAAGPEAIAARIAQAILGGPEAGR